MLVLGLNPVLIMWEWIFRPWDGFSELMWCCRAEEIEVAVGGGFKRLFVSSVTSGLGQWVDEGKVDLIIGSKKLHLNRNNIGVNKEGRNSLNNREQKKHAILYFSVNAEKRMKESQART